MVGGKGEGRTAEAAGRGQFDTETTAADLAGDEYGYLARSGGGVV